MTATAVHKSAPESRDRRRQGAQKAREAAGGTRIPTKGSRQAEREPRGASPTPASPRTTSDRRAKGSPKRSPTTTQTPLRRGAESVTTTRPSRQPDYRPNRTVFSVEKALTMSGFVIAGLLILLFGLDLATEWPFHRYSLLMDVGYCICGALLVFLSWHTYRELP